MCPNAACGMPGAVEEAHDGAPQTHAALGIGGVHVVEWRHPLSRLLRCAYCRRAFCMHCSRPWHAPEPCAFQARVGRRWGGSTLRTAH